MQHFYDSLDGWFNYPSVYLEAVKNAKNGDHFVEVGAWMGKSTSFMGVEIVNSGKQIKFDVVDTWEGSLEHRDHSSIIQKELYDVFLENTKPLENVYTPVRMTSLEAAKTYKDNSLDFVMLDASHEYEDIKNDIFAWYPKVKPGGVLSGDDFHSDWPGVIKAVQEIFQNFRICDTRSWIIVKP